MSAEIAVVIGSGSIGVAIARRAGVGRHLVLADYDQEAMESVAELLCTEGHDVSTHPLDLSDHTAVRNLADEAAARGDVTRVVVAAGVSPVKASTQRVLAVDLAGTAYALEEFGRVVVSGGSGLVIASMAGHMGDGVPRDLERALAHTSAGELLALPELDPEVVGDSGAAYGLAKRSNALRVQAEAVRWGDRGARVNCLSPGIVSTPLAQEEMSGPHAAGYAAMIERSAAGRMATAAEIAQIAAVLLGPDGAFVTGADLLIDGGVVAAMRAGRLG